MEILLEIVREREILQVGFSMETWCSDFRMHKNNPNYRMRADFPNLTHDEVWASLEKNGLEIVFQIIQGFHGDVFRAFQTISLV